VLVAITNLPLESQFTIVTSKRSFVYDINYKNKIIEFNEDYWHMNPKIYTEIDINKRCKKTAKEIWARDLVKHNIAINKGYQLLVVWEKDFKNNRQGVVDECLHFLHNK
jgi:very-short-patch-repair endonuclease